MITDKQLKYLEFLLTRLEPSLGKDRFKILSKRAFRPVDAPSELTMIEARRIISELHLELKSEIAGSMVWIGI